MATLVPPAPGPRSFGTGIVVGLVVALLIVVTVAGTVLLLKRDEDAAGVGASPSSPSPSPSRQPSASRTPTHPPTVVSNDFNRKNSWSRGERLSFAAFWVDYPDADCKVHTYTWKGATRGALRSDCASWEADGYDILLFFVGFKNTSERPVTLILRDFSLEGRDSRTFGPVNIRERADFPTSFLPETLKLPPRQSWFGFVTFDGRVEALVPASISYIDGAQTLTQVFAGRHAVV
ncbi:MAG: hypothetical protein WD096_01270 [Actinomycetota bacterium]